MSPCNTTNLVRLAACACAVLVLAGCASTTAVEQVVAEPPARLKVVNLTDHAWRVAFVRTGVQPARSVEITPRARSEIELPAGRWAIEQTILTADGSPGQTRTFPANFAAGESYDWPLATLQTRVDEGSDQR